MPIILPSGKNILVNDSRGRLSRKYRWWVHKLLLNLFKFGAAILWFKKKKKKKEAKSQQKTHIHKKNPKQQTNSLDDDFKEFSRLSKHHFAYVLSLTEDLVKYCKSREVIFPRQRLAICRPIR